MTKPIDGDSTLLQRLRDSDASALDALVERYWQPLVTYAAGLLECPDAAEDLVQEAFVRLWERRQSIECDRTLAPFLYRIVRNLGLNERRSRQARVQMRQQVRSRPMATQAPTPIETFDERELRVAVERAIRALPPRRRQVFVLARFHACSYREIAELLNLSPQTVANQMCAALSTLREALKDYLDGPTQPD